MEILNIQYLLYREQLQEFVEKFLFEPVARRKGFVEVDEYGEEHVIYPKFTFTRMSIRDNDSVFEQVFQLYQKGSVPVDTVLELLGLDADLSKVRIEEDLFTVNDSSFNALLNGAYQAAANDLVTKSNLTARAAKALGLETVAPPTEGDAGAGGGDAGGGALRFANAEMKEIMRLAGSDPDKLKKVLAMLQEPNA
jgi:hypothetical protein